ncbi:MAG: hypothetical protein PHX68_00605 [Alphaproteobacteria bacterium]|nr:hypothetical protein [Alphaproteobacteria bacterium]
MVQKAKKSKKKVVVRPAKKAAAAKARPQKAAVRRVKKAAPAPRKTPLVVGPQRTAAARLPAVSDIRLPAVVERKPCGFLNKASSGLLFAVYVLAVGLIGSIAMPVLLTKAVVLVGVLALLWQIAKTARVYWRRQLVLAAVSAALMYQLFTTLRAGFPDTAYLSLMLLPLMLFFAWHNPQTNKGVAGFLALLPILIFMSFVSGIVGLVHAGMGAWIGPVFLVTALFFPVLLAVHWIWLKLLMGWRWFAAVLVLEIGSLVILSRVTMPLLARLRAMPAPDWRMTEAAQPQIALLTGIFLATLVLSLLGAYAYHFVKFVRRRRG